MPASSSTYSTSSCPKYEAEQLKAFDGKKLQSTTKEGFDIDGEDDKQKVEVLKAEIDEQHKYMTKVPDKKLCLEQELAAQQYHDCRPHEKTAKPINVGDDLVLLRELSLKV